MRSDSAQVRGLDVQVLDDAVDHFLTGPFAVRPPGARCPVEDVPDDLVVEEERVIRFDVCPAGDLSDGLVDLVVRIQYLADVAG